jgi:guanylate kinase
MKKNLILISGPSCVGKGPLLAKLKEFHGDIKFGGIPVIKSYGSRGGVLRPTDDPEYFMPDEDFKNLDDNYIVGDCRGYPQAIDLREITKTEYDLLILEVYHTFGEQFRKHNPELLENINVTGVFISPISEEEKNLLKNAGVYADAYIVDMMLNKQLRRAEVFGKTVTAEDMKEFISRAQDAPDELRAIKNYDEVIICNDGEGHPNWDGIPAGSAGKALEKLACIIKSI